MVSSPLFPRPRTGSRSSPPDAFDVPIPTSPDSSDREGSHPPRQSSLGFIRRMKSVERVTTRRRSSGGKLTKKQSAMEREQQAREATAIPQFPPRIPDLPSPGRLQTFGGEDAKPLHTNGQSASPGRLGQFNSNRATPNFPFGSDGSHVPVPPMPQSLSAGRGEYMDPYAKTESMTHRGRYSYANSIVSTVNSPRRMRRRKDPTPFNILIVGARNSGKTSFLNFLKTSLVSPERSPQSPARNGHPDMSHASSRPSIPNFDSQYQETEIDGERIGLTLWDSQGLDQNVADLQLREISAFVESKFEDTFTEEMKVVRATGVQDTHIHCVFLILDPVRLDANLARTPKTSPLNGFHTNGKSHAPAPDALDENLDLQVLRTLQGKTTVVPIISKADTITVAHMASLKRAVWTSLKNANLDPLEALGLDEAADERDNLLALDRSDSHLKRLDNTTSDDTDTDNSVVHTKPTPVLSPGEIPAFPLSILSPDPATPSIVGRQFAWGFADPYKPDHCDFVRLKDAVFREWRGELREASRELWYEGWRTERLDRGAGRRGVGKVVVKEEIGRALPYQNLVY